jgi:hypothetical protein
LVALSGTISSSDCTVDGLRSQLWSASGGYNLLVVHPTNAWTPVIRGYDAQSNYLGINQPYTPWQSAGTYMGFGSPVVNGVLQASNGATGGTYQGLFTHCGIIVQNGVQSEAVSTSSPLCKTGSNPNDTFYAVIVADNTWTGLFNDMRVEASFSGFPVGALSFSTTVCLQKVTSSGLVSVGSCSTKTASLFSPSGATSHSFDVDLDSYFPGAVAGIYVVRCTYSLGSTYAATARVTVTKE